MIRLALLSRWHVHADDYARQAEEHPELSIAAVWDEDPERGRAWAAELRKEYRAALEEVLQDPAIDGVIVCTPTSMHHEIIGKCVAGGKHVFTEKVLALRTDECGELYDRAAMEGVRLMVSMPRLTEPVYLAAQQVLDSGRLGDLTSIRCRLAHDGAVPRTNRPHGWLPPHFFDPVTCGGGALIDLGAHPIYVTNRLAGRAASVSARMTSRYGYEVDDNAVVTVEYENGALGVIETGFVSSGSPFTLELYGTKGAWVARDGRILLTGEAEGSPAALPDRLPDPMEQWVRWIRDGAAPAITREDAVLLTQLNEAAALSNREGVRVTLGKHIRVE